MSLSSDFMDIALNESYYNINEFFGFGKKKSRLEEVDKYIKFAKEVLNKNAYDYGDLGYNSGEALGTILALKFMKIPEKQVIDAIKDAKKNVIKFSEYEDGENSPGIKDDQDIVLLYGDEDAPFINLKDNKIYHINFKNGSKIEPVSLYSLVNSSDEKIYFNKSEFDKVYNKQ